MPLEPTQAFVVNAITREQIAEALQEYVEATGDGTTLSYGDWLTDEFCTKFASELGKLEDPDNDDEEYQAFLWRMLKDELGIDLS